MKHFAKKVPFCFSVLCAMLMTAFPQEVLSGDAPLTEGLVIEKIFQPGTGTKVGTVRMVQGEALVIHTEKDKIGYPVAENTPLFKGDTLITLKKGRLQLELSDGSVLTVASETRMTVSRSVFDEQQQTRSSFVDMVFGKVRYVVKKYTDFGTQDFKVKTKTAVVGVRGSDFIVKSGEKYTEVITLENTELEIVRLAALEEKPSVLKDFEKIVIETDAVPSEITKVSPEEVEQMIMEMAVMPESREEVSLPEAESAEKKDAEIKSPESEEKAEPMPEMEAAPESPGEVRDAEPGEEKTAEAESGTADVMGMEPEESGEMLLPEDMGDIGAEPDQPVFENDMPIDEQSILDDQEEIIEDNVKENISPPKTGEMISLPRPPTE